MALKVALPQNRAQSISEHVESCQFSTQRGVALVLITIKYMYTNCLVREINVQSMQGLIVIIYTVVLDERSRKRAFIHLILLVHCM